MSPTAPRGGGDRRSGGCWGWGWFDRWMLLLLHLAKPPAFVQPADGQSPSCSVFTPASPSSPHPTTSSAPPRCYDKATLYSFAKHYETGEPLPLQYYERLKAAKTFRAGSMMLRQIHFSCIDLELHARFTPGSGESVFERDQAVAKKTQVSSGGGARGGKEGGE